MHKFIALFLIVGTCMVQLGMSNPPTPNVERWSSLFNIDNCSPHTIGQGVSVPGKNLDVFANEARDPQRCPHCCPHCDVDVDEDLATEANAVSSKSFALFVVGSS